MTKSGATSEHNRKGQGIRTTQDIEPIKTDMVTDNSPKESTGTETWITAHHGNALVWGHKDDNPRRIICVMSRQPEAQHLNR